MARRGAACAESKPNDATPRFVTPRTHERRYAFCMLDAHTTAFAELFFRRVHTCMHMSTGMAGFMSARVTHTCA